MEIEDNTCAVGILNEPFLILEKLSSELQSNEKPLLCSLLIYETTVKTHKSSEKSNLEQQRAIIFMVISLTSNWKIPIELIFTDESETKILAEAVEACITKLHEISIDIVSITMDCLTSNKFALAEHLDKMNLMTANVNSNTNYIHPICGKIYLLYDLNTLIEQLESYWKTIKVLIHKEDSLDYCLITKIGSITENNLKNYSSEVVFDWCIIKKRLSYDDKKISKTTADALMYLRDIKYPGFQRSSATIQFIRVLDYIGNFSEGLDSNHSDMNEVKRMLFKILEYFKDLKEMAVDIPELMSVFKTWVLGIIITINSIVQIWDDYSIITENKENWSQFPKKISLSNVNILFNSMLSTEKTTLGLYKKIKTMTKHIYPVHVKTN